MSDANHHPSPPAMLWPDVRAFVVGSLPPPPARVLEVGAGDGQLAAALRGLGYDVVAIDPREDPGEGVNQVALAALSAPQESFDAAVAVIALHHVEPLAESLERLASVLRPGAPLLVDELDVAALDDRAMAWWSAQQQAAGTPIDDIDRVRGEMQGHLHDVEAIAAALAPHFDVGGTVRGTYLHRWHLPPGLRAAEEELVGAGRLPAVGVRVVGRRRHTGPRC